MISCNTIIISLSQSRILYLSFILSDRSLCVIFLRLVIVEHVIEFLSAHVILLRSVIVDRFFHLSFDVIRFFCRILAVHRCLSSFLVIVFCWRFGFRIEVPIRERRFVDVPFRIGRVWQLNSHHQHYDDRNHCEHVKSCWNCFWKREKKCFWEDSTENENYLKLYRKVNKDSFLNNSRNCNQI